MADEPPEEGPRSITPEQRAAERDIHSGAQDAGVKIAGLTEVAEYEDCFAGSKDDPVLIGQKMTVRVRVAEDGTPLPRREDSDESTPPATSILTIEVTPSIEFDSSGDPHVVWNGHASQVDVGTTRVITSSLSGPSREEDEALRGARPHHEYADDPAYKDAMLAKMAKSPAEAVTQALAPLVGSGRMNVGRAEPAPVSEPTPARPPVGPTETPSTTGLLGSRPGCMVGAAVVAFILIAAAVVTMLLVGDSGDDSPESVAEAESPAPTPSADEPEPESTGSEEPDEEPDSGETGSGETGSEEPTDEPEPDEAEAGLMPGTYEVVGRVDSACGGVYDVFLRIVLFLNGQATVEQLLTPGGNPFQSAAGQWNSLLVAASALQPGFFEVWLVTILADALSVYNVYGPSAGAIADGGALDPGQVADVDSAEGLFAAVQADPESCASELLDVTSTYTPFPGETAVG